MVRSFGLVIPTRSRPLELRACLAAIAHELVPEVREIVVVDDASSPPAQIEVSFPPEVSVRLVRNAQRLGAAASRNRGAALIRSAAIGFLDDDVQIESGWQRTAILGMIPERAAITGPVQALDCGVVARARQLRYDERYKAVADGSPVEFLAGGNSVVWRDDFWRAGGFPLEAVMSDNVLASKLAHVGRKCCFVSSLRVRHRHSKGVVVAIRQAWLAGRSERTPVRGDSLDLRHAFAAIQRQPDRLAATLNAAFAIAMVAGRQRTRFDRNPRASGWRRRAISWPGGAVGGRTD